MTGTASQRLRDLVEALPVEARKPWIYHDDSMAIPEPQAVRVLLLADGALLEAGEDLTESEARLIAAVASPDRVLLLAELLEAIQALAEIDRSIIIDGFTQDTEYARYTAAVGAVLSARDALASAPTGEANV